MRRYSLIALLFIPKKSYEYWRFNRDDYGLDLYVRRVLIQHQNKELLPEYLSFVKGVVDSEDLPLKHFPRNFAGKYYLHKNCTECYKQYSF
ncbi:MAG: hypothetical protein MZV64_57590 [Ignavibacteriales bacterium]|nr:hypothetical protein [Ignavibacteriales bacterium]